MGPAVVDAWRGKMEAGNGQPLTSVQIDQLAPFLSSAYSLPAADVRAELREVRLYLGGPAAHTPWNAVTLGHDIYVRSGEELKVIESWKDRRWLAHECGHVMQFERIPSPQAPTAKARLRRFLRNYGTRLVVSAGGRPGALPRGLAWWLNENINPFNHARTHISLTDAIHDSHDMEREAELHAEEFSDSTPGPKSRGHFDRSRP
jgi:hypothetical protein